MGIVRQGLAILVLLNLSTNNEIFAREKKASDRNKLVGSIREAINYRSLIVHMVARKKPAVLSISTIIFIFIIYRILIKLGNLVGVKETIGFQKGCSCLCSLVFNLCCNKCIIESLGFCIKGILNLLHSQSGDKSIVGLIKQTFIMIRHLFSVICHIFYSSIFGKFLIPGQVGILCHKLCLGITKLSPSGISLSLSGTGDITTTINPMLQSKLTLGVLHILVTSHAVMLISPICAVVFIPGFSCCFQSLTCIIIGELCLTILGCIICNFSQQGVDGILSIITSVGVAFKCSLIDNTTPVLFLIGLNILLCYL